MKNWALVALLVQIAIVVGLLVEMVRAQTDFKNYKKLNDALILQYTNSCSKMPKHKQDAAVEKTSEKLKQKQKKLSKLQISFGVFLSLLLGFLTLMLIDLPTGGNIMG